MKRLFAALQFLTVLPGVSRIACTERDLGRSVPFFPVVGLLIGGVLVGVDRLLGSVLAPLPATVLIVIAMLAVSGGLHADGLADTADGFLSARPRERILEIMKDSHIGVMGVIAIVSVFTLKVAALSAVPSPRRWPALLLMPLAGRCALVLEMGVLPYARPEGGLGSVFVRNRSRFDIFWALAWLAAAGYVAAGYRGLLAGAGAVVWTLVFSLWCRRTIGGFTGDTLGAACEIAELAPALLLGLR